MNTEVLIDYILGRTTSQESEEVMDWVAQSEENKEFLITLTNMMALLPREKDIVVSDNEYERFMDAIKEKSSGNKRTPAGWWDGNFMGKAFRYAAVAVLIISVTLNILQFTLDRVPKRIEAQTLICGTRVADSLKREIYVAKGEKSRVELPDGTVVWLNSDSRITFPLKFSAQAREVTLSGEAYFDVVENPNHPMIVRLGNNYSLKVLGTVFNVKSYNNENAIETTLYSGKVDIYEDGKDIPIHSMIPNETFIIRPMVSIIQEPESVKNISPDIMEKIAAWKDGMLYFEESHLDNVVIKLERWYGVELKIEDGILCDCKYTAAFENAPIVNVLEDMKEKLPLDYIIEENVIYLKRKL